MSNYSLKYFFEADVQGHTNRLEIYQKNDSGATIQVKYLGALQGWTMGLVGSGGVADPIIKTQCSITLVDAPDLTDYHSEGERLYPCKMGDYEEFYTSDATYYKVIVKTDGVARWTGFITPDSFQEDLSYHSTVNLTARDNIGHLQDMEFDANPDLNGMVCIRDIISGAVAKIGGMSWDQSYVIPLTGINATTSANVLDTYVNVSMFKDKNWYEALDTVLSSLGLCLRWNDHNKFVVFDIAHQSDGLNHASHEDDRIITVCNASGTRELDPAYKKIIDTLNYESGNIAEAKFGENDYRTATATIAGHSVSGHQPSTLTQWYCHGNILTLNPFIYSRNPYFGLNFKTDDNIFLSLVDEAKWSADNYIYTQIPIVYGGNTLRIEYSFNSQLYTGNDTSGYMNVSMPQMELNNFIIHKWAVKALIGGNYRYFNAKKGKWQSALVWNEANCQSSDSFDSVNDMSASVQCDFQIDKNVTSVTFMLSSFLIAGSYATYTFPDMLYTPDVVSSGKCYGRLSNFKVTLADISDYDYSKTTTIYNEDNNVVLNRSTEIGQVPQLPTCKVITNGIYLKKTSNIYPAAIHWNYIDSYNTAQYNLPVWIAQQILTLFNAPMSIISGEIMDLEKKDPRFNAVWTWKNKNFIMVAGTLDLLSNHITGAQLRQICDYEDVWESQEGQGETPVDPTPVDPTPVTPTTFSVSPRSFEITYNAQTISVTVSADSEVSYSITSSNDWITVPASSATGSQTLSFSIRRNATSSARLGIIMIGSSRVTVQQAAGSLSPTEENIGETGSIEIDGN